MNARERQWLSLWTFHLLSLVSAFQSIGAPSICRHPQHHHHSRSAQIVWSVWSSARSANADAAKKTTLTEATTWKMRLVLSDKMPTKAKDEIYSLNGYFQEDEGYEPPQGTFHGRGGEQTATAGTKLEVVKSRWMLSEDPDDRKDSLWIWGLFSEPLYPFLLLQISLAEKDENGTSTPWPPLYAQISHRRKDGSVFLEPTELKVRNLEQLNADPFGAAKVDIYGEDSVGRISFQPIV